MFPGDTKPLHMCDNIIRKQPSQSTAPLYYNIIIIITIIIVRLIKRTPAVTPTSRRALALLYTDMTFAGRAINFSGKLRACAQCVRPCMHYNLYYIGFNLGRRRRRRVYFRIIRSVVCVSLRDFSP